LGFRFTDDYTDCAMASHWNHNAVGLHPVPRGWSSEDYLGVNYGSDESEPKIRSGNSNTRARFNE